MPRALLPESPGFSYAGVFWFGFIPDKFSPGLRTLYAREYSGISKISQFRQNTPVQKYFLTWIEKPRPANVSPRFLWRVFSDFAWGPVEPAQFLRSLTIHVTLGPMHLPIGRTPRPSPAGFTYPRNKPGFMLQYFFRVWCMIHRKLQHTPAYNWGVLALLSAGAWFSQDQPPCSYMQHMNIGAPIRKSAHSRA